MKRILLIDDAEFARVTLRLMLEEKGYEVCGEAEDGFQGIEKFKQLKPDLTLCDIRMNGMSGLECMEKILSEDPAARLVVCAAINSDEQVETALRLGALGIVKKPININELTKTVEEALNASPKKKSYKEIMEERAAAENIEVKCLLDFLSAFKSINGFALDDPKASKEFLEKNTEGTLIAIRALVSQKISLSQLNTLENIFRELTF